MAIDSVVTLIDALSRSRLLDAEQLAALQRDAPARFQQPRELAKDLIARGWLTKFQAKQLLNGQGEGLSLGPYRLLERLGAGGMGQVFKALHVPMNRIVALKILRPEFMADSRTQKRFRREVQAAAQLNHPNIVTVFDAAQIGEIHFLAMEYIDGADLAQLVRETGMLQVTAACEYIRQAAIGLQHAHDRGLIHRDVKPSNLLVTRNHPAGIVKILDMGLARAAPIVTWDGNAPTSLTLDGTVVGTPDFMSPEQGRDSRSVDSRSDIYSLGCTIFFLLSGRMPFPDGNVIDKLLQHQTEPIRSIETIRSDVPPGVVAILNKLTAKRPDDRFQTAAEVAAALERFCEGDGSSPLIDAIPMGSTSPFVFEAESTIDRPPTTVKRPRNNLPLYILAALLGGLLCALILVGAIALLRKKPAASDESPPPLVPTTETASPKVPIVKSDRMTADEITAACIPDDAALVVVADLRQLAKSEAIAKHFAPWLHTQFEVLEQLKSDSRITADRLVAASLPGMPERTITAIVGSYWNDDLKSYGQKSFGLTPRVFGDGVAMPIGTIVLQRGQRHFVGLLQDSILAFASDVEMLHAAELRLRNRRKAGGERILRQMPADGGKASMRFVITGAYDLQRVPLEKYGIIQAVGTMSFTDRLDWTAVIRVSDLAQFRDQYRVMRQAVTASALFDARMVLPAMLLRNVTPEPGKVDDRGQADVRMRKSVSAVELDTILKGLVSKLPKRIDQP